MRHRPIGPSGLSVAQVGLGAMSLSLQGRPPEAEGIRTIHTALDAGMTLIDTADVYCVDDEDIGHNERLVRKALAAWSGPPDAPVVATKGGLERPAGDWTVNGHPDHIRHACEQSLRALGVEQIALYQLHAPDDHVPFAETIGALSDLRAEGKIAHVGLSNVTAAQIDEARAIVAIVSVQNRCNPFDREPFHDGVLAACERHGLAFFPYSPVGGVHGKTRAASDDTLVEVGARHGATPYEIAIAWLLSASPVIIPIPGASRPESAQSSARAGSLTLTDADLAELERAFPTGRR